MVTEFQYSLKSKAFVDLYGNILRKCKTCNILKDYDFFNGTNCNSCKYRIEKTKGGLNYLDRKNNAVKKHNSIKRASKPTKEDKEKEYYSKHNGKHCKVYFKTCLITNKLYCTNNKKSSYSKTEIKGDYKSTFNLYLALKNKGRYHKCSQCNKDIDLTINGRCYSNNLTLCSKECTVKHTSETKHNARHRRRLAISNKSERISRSKVFTKDNYTCYLCNIKVVVYKDLKDKWNKKDAATIDHVIALANGGTHTYDNVRTCCSWCNSNKRDL
jgi:hypothetical protein